MDKLALRQIVGNEIRRQRESQGLTLRILADMVGSSYSHLWKVEHAKVSVGLDLLGEIADALDVPVCDLVDPPRHQHGKTYVITTHSMQP